MTSLDLDDLCHFDLVLTLILLVDLMQVIVGGEIRTLLPFLDLSVAVCQSQIRKIAIQLLLIRFYDISYETMINFDNRLKASVLIISLRNWEREYKRKWHHFFRATFR